MNMWIRFRSKIQKLCFSISGEREGKIERAHRTELLMMMLWERCALKIYILYYQTNQYIVYARVFITAKWITNPEMFDCERQKM